MIADGRIVGAILLGPGNDVAAVRTAITAASTSPSTSARCAGPLDGLAKLSGGSRSSPAAAA